MRKLILPLLVAALFGLSVCRPKGQEPMPIAPEDTQTGDTVRPETIDSGTGVSSADSPSFFQILTPAQDSIRYNLPRITMQFSISADTLTERRDLRRKRFGIYMKAGRLLGDEFCIMFEVFSYIYYFGDLQLRKYNDFVPDFSDAGYVECDISNGACRRIDTSSYIRVHAVDFARRRVRISYDLRYYRLPSEVTPRSRHLPMSFRFTQTEPIVVRLVN